MTLRTPGASAATRCSACARGLSFQDWSAGKGRCASCQQRGESAPPGGRIHTRTPSVAPSVASRSGYRAYQRMVDDVPDELMDELARALGEEAIERQRQTPDDAASLLRGVAQDLQLGRTRAEFQWAFFGFTGGFAANVALMKYVQMASSASFDAVFAPMFLGGLMTGGTCAVIGWGIAKLKER